MSCEDCVTRRNFLIRSAAVAAAAALLESCGDGIIGAAGGDNVPPGGPITIRVADFPALATVGQPVRVGDRRAAVRVGTDSFIALSMICTHEQTTVNVTGTQFLCPNHLSRFSSSGAVINGPAASPLVQLTSTYDVAAGTLTIS